MKKVNLIESALVSDLIYQIRNKNSDTQQFTSAMSRLGSILAVNCLTNLPTETKEVETPITKTKAQVIDQKKIHLISIFRAGESLLLSFRDFLPLAKSEHLGIKRNEIDLTANTYLNTISNIASDDKVFILDPMLATAATACLAISKITEIGQAKSIDFVSVISSVEGIERITKKFPNVRITTCQIDENLNEKGYIVPGLGDAGDRYFAT